MNWKKEIEYQFPQFSDLVEVGDEKILDKSIPLDDCEAIFLGRENHQHTVLVCVKKHELMYRDDYSVNTLSTYENDEENGQIEHEWCEIGIIDR